MNNIVELDSALKGVAPVYGVSVKDPDDKSTWRINFAPEATDAQKALAQDVMDNFDFTLLPEPKSLEERIAVLESKVSSLESK